MVIILKNDKKYADENYVSNGMKLSTFLKITPNKKKKDM